ncbi:hypothetical protein [Prevotella sp. 10(H)]|uniref:hypothetical protein n=1 Tax=Prevotella sp. 10(H) TaxID=1158294 RepID=UPI0004A71918|nr:hypothetical protein [Prevotella sp. 10(H)]
MEKKFSEQDSLNLINEMITQAQNNFRKGAGNTSIFCGYFVALTAIFNYILLHTLSEPRQSFWVWILMIPMMAIVAFINRKKKREAIVTTHIDKIVSNIWKAFAISVIVFILVIFGSACILKTAALTIIITPCILLMMGTAQFVTSVACRFRLYFYGAIIFWTGAILSVATYFTGDSSLQFIILAACVIAGLSIPGHIANRKAKKHV